MDSRKALMQATKEVVQKGFEIAGVPPRLASQVAEILLRDDFSYTSEESQIIKSAAIWMKAKQEQT